MQPGTSVIILVGTLIVLAVSLFTISHRRAHKAKRAAAVEAAKTDFLIHSVDKNVSIDSTYIKNDTLFFYKHNTFVGKTVIVNE